MNDMIINTNSLPDVLFRLIPTDRVQIKETDGIIQLVPMKENADCTRCLRGLFANDPEMTVDKFLSRKHAERVLEL